jgi:hypothetical protein
MRWYTHSRSARLALPLAALACLIACPLFAAEEGETLTRELWYTGTIQEQPAASMHVMIYDRADKTRRTVAETSILLVRTLGAQTVRITMAETQEMIENSEGRLERFHIDQDQNGSVTTATGHVEGQEIVATIARLGRTETQRVEIPAETQLLGMQSAQELLTDPNLVIGDQRASSGVVLLSGSVSIMTSEAELTEQRADGNRLFIMRTPAMPPFRTLMDPSGDLVKMEVNLGFLELILTRSEQAAVLAGAEISPTGFAKATGPTPRADAENHYRLGEAAEQVPADAFQSIQDGVVTIRSVAKPSIITDKERQLFLSAEPQFEIDDPELQAWVKASTATTTADLAETLRLATRTRLTEKDLSLADGSALEAFRTQHGDCTEHANLLTAALRIAGIPARTEVGVVFAAAYGGWVGHAWNSAYIDGTWVHLDSAYPGIPRSLYLKLACTSGENAVSTAGALANGLVALSGSSIEYLHD